MSAPSGAWPSGGAMVCGILGHPVAHSLSPWMHRLFAAQFGLDFLYAPFPVHPAALPAALTGLAALGLRGVNVTIPHKEAVFAAVGQRSPVAATVGAINTLRFDAHGAVEGHNTDAPGFLRALRRHGGRAWEGQPALVIGAGGAARGVLWALVEGGCGPIYLSNRSPERAVALAAAFPDWPLQVLPLEARALTPHLPDCGLVVNTSSRGLHGEGHPELVLEALADSGIVCDIVYKPLETPLLAAARARGLRTVDGLGMLVEQGVESFAWWTGQDPDPVPVEKALRHWLRQTPKPVP